MSDVAGAAALVAFPVAAAPVGSLVAAVRGTSLLVVAGVQPVAAGVVIAALLGK